MAKANDDNNTYSNQMIKEFDIFQKARETELKQGLAAYADCHLDFYKKVIRDCMHVHHHHAANNNYRASLFGKIYYLYWIRYSLKKIKTNKK